MPEPALASRSALPAFVASCSLLLGSLLAAAWLFRWEVTPLAWDRAEGSRAILLDRWTGRTWLVQKQGLRETFKLTP